MRYIEEKHNKVFTKTGYELDLQKILMPTFISKSTEASDNIVNLDFFISSAYERAQKNLGRHDFIMQRYIQAKGNQPSILRAVWKSPDQIDLFKISSKKRLDGKNDSKALTVEVLNNFIQTNP